jgi:hypothetical protein
MNYYKVIILLLNKKAIGIYTSQTSTLPDLKDVSLSKAGKKGEIMGIILPSQQCKELRVHCTPMLNIKTKILLIIIFFRRRKEIACVSVKHQKRFLPQSMRKVFLHQNKEKEFSN